VDNLEAIHEVCATYAIWMHVDAAYGGVLHYHLQVNEYYMAYLTHSITVRALRGRCTTHSRKKYFAKST